MKFIKKNIDRIILIIVLAVLTILLFNYIVNTLKSDKVDNFVTEIDKIEKYEYSLFQDDSEIFKKYFLELKSELGESEINYENYAKLISKLFVIDFYTLDNKETNMDIGGIQFLKNDIVDNFILKATDTMYKYIKSDINNSKQELPIVEDVEITDIKNIGDGYEVSALINYVKDLNYPSKVIIGIIKDNNKLAIKYVK